jgi:tyrosyl-tRNA synthetase
VSINKAKVESAEALVNAGQLLHGRYIMIENGKKNKYLLVAE